MKSFKPLRYNLRLFNLVDVQPPFLTFYWACAARRNRKTFEPGYADLCAWSQFMNGGTPAVTESLEVRCPLCGGEAYAALYAV